MKHLIFLGFVFILIFSGCDEERDFRNYCADEVRFRVEPPTSFEIEPCYDDKGMIDMFIFNNGNEIIQSFNFFIDGENENKNFTVPLKLNARDADILSINVQLKTIGKINRIDISPNILFHNETLECMHNNVIIRKIDSCY